jgi:hypothetical protein
VLDASVFRSEQPIFLPPTDVLLARFLGEPLSVDRYLERARELPPDAAQSAQQGPQKPGGRATEGGRNKFLSDRAYALVRAGLPHEQLVEALLKINAEKCEPPLDADEVAAIARGKNRIDPDASEQPDTEAEGEADGDDEDDCDILAQRMPSIDPVAFYGPLQHIVDAATQDSEATSVGVALHLMASVAAAFYSPFRIDLGDDRIALNAYFVQVGRSARGRKGTSAAPTDKHLLRALYERLGAFAAAMEEQGRAREERAALRHQKRAEARQAEQLAQRIRSVTPADAERLRQEQEKAEKDKALAAERIAHFEQKLQVTTLAPDTLRGYARAHADAEAALRAVDAAIQRIQGEREQLQQWLDDPEKKAAAEAEQRHKQITSELAADAGHEPAVLAPWQRILADFATPAHVLRGVSSGEGLINHIRDDREVLVDGEMVLEEGEPNKRLFLNLSEMGGLLAQTRRAGSILSAVIRDGYDCSPLQTNSKISPCSVAEPYISMSASITPAELVGLLFDPRDAQVNADNGLGNRPLYAWVLRTKLVSRPGASGGGVYRVVDEITDVLFANLMQVFEALKPTDEYMSVPIEFDDAGAAEWDSLYARLDALEGSSENAAKLHGRTTTNGRKIAAILALLNGEPTIGPGAVRAAAAWVEYGSKTVDAVVSTVVSRRAHARRKADAECVLKALTELAEGTPGELVAQREVRRKAGNMKAARMQAAVTYLEQLSPPPVRVFEQHVVVGNGAKKSRAYLALTEQ